MTRLMVLITLVFVTACGPVVERWDGELDDCNNGSDLDGRRVLLYLELDPGSTDADGWIGVAESPGSDETFLFTDLEDGSFDGEDLDFDADFGTINATIDMSREGNTFSGEVDVDYPFFGGDQCDIELELS